MAKYVVRRLLWTVIVILCISVMTFVLAYVVPTDPAAMLAGPKSTPEIIARIRHNLGLDGPPYVQYGRYLWRLAHGDLGYSYYSRRPVAGMILARFPATALLAVFGIGFELLIGIPTGMVSALRRGSRLDRSMMFGSVVGVASPPFWLGLMLLYVFAFSLGWFPLGGYAGWLHPIYAVLPGLTIGLVGGAWYARLLRSSMLNILGMDFVRAARAKGLPERTVISRHVLRNAWGPVLSLLGVDFAWTFGGVLIIEIVFGVPGIGWQAWTAVQNNDVPLVMGTVLFSALVVCTANLVVDIGYTWLDPRIQRG